jgi:hypothetical protein
MFIWDFSFFLTIFRPNRQNKQRPESPLLKQHRSMDPRTLWIRAVQLVPLSAMSYRDRHERPSRLLHVLPSALESLSALVSEQIADGESSVVCQESEGVWAGMEVPIYGGTGAAILALQSVQVSL